MILQCVLTVWSRAAWGERPVCHLARCATSDNTQRFMWDKAGRGGVGS